MDKLKTLLPPVLLFVLVMGLTHWHGLTRLRIERETLGADLDVLCSHKAEDLKGVLSQLLRTTEMLAMMMSLGTLDRRDFDAAAAAIQTAFPGIETVGFTAEDLPGLASQKIGTLRGGAESSEGGREPVAIFSGPFKLHSGQTGFMGRSPVYREHAGQRRFLGFVTAVMTLETAERFAGLKLMTGVGYVYGVEIQTGSSENWNLLAGGEVREGNISASPLHINGVTLRLLLGRAGSMAGLGGYWAGYVGASVFALAISVLLYLLLSIPERLRSIASARIAKLREVNSRLVGEIRKCRQTSKELEASQELSRAMFENNPAVKLLVDPQALRIVEGNPAAVRFYGWSSEELAGKPVSDISRLATDEIEKSIEKAMSGAHGPIRARHMLATGEIRDVEIYSGLVRRKNKKLLQSVVQDVTERENARRELKKNRERLKSLFNSVDSAIVEVNDDGQILLVNQAFADLFGIDQDKAIGMSYMDITHPDDIEISKHTYSAFKSGRAGRFCLQKRYLRADGGEFWGNVCITCIRDASGEITGTVAVITDVTLLLEAKNAAEEASRTKSRFLANISHEVRSPLNAIIGLTELTMRSGLDDMQRQNLEKSLASCRVLLAVIESILEFASIESGRLELAHTAFCPADMLDGLRERFRLDAENKGLILRVEGGESLPPELLGDPVRLEQILANLISNALKFTEHGEVVVRASVEMSDRDTATLMFSVSDTGIGMEEDQAEALFQPFNQADASLTKVHGGTGLGLSIARGLVELMGGELEWESINPRGSVFSFRAVLRLSGQQPESSSGEGDLQNLSELVQGLSGMRVLIVDDNLLSRHTAREVLGHAELVTVVAENGPLAVEAVRNEQFDAVLLDLNMPDMDGFDTFKAIRELPGGRDLPVIALTGRASHEDRVRSLAAGMDEHLTKPLDAASLFAALRLVSHRRRGGREPSTMDSRHALVLLMGNRKLYARLLKGFLREYEQSGHRMGELIASGAIGDAVILAHSIKGLAANLGGEKLSRASLELESALRASDFTRISVASELFEQAVREFSLLAERTAEEMEESA
jgi:PAS domain S-box-containing protein